MLPQQPEKRPVYKLKFLPVADLVALHLQLQFMPANLGKKAAASILNLPSFATKSGCNYSLVADSKTEFSA
ncbi:hypothetical protein GCM10008111_22460 [Alishewanella tabrizica]|uniref:Transposase n=1 Tax=Alishewanella tabrizica TaxID=671278 RepID=A0ABQ2WNT6_9ALTE|nr:hypothetical protein GCM10008111_22460 [Alishewanella tabrizica]